MPRASRDSGRSEVDCCCEPSVAEGSQDSVEFGDHRLDPIQLRVRATAFKLFLHTGQPAHVGSIAEAAGVDLAATIEVLGGFTRTGNVSMTGERVVGIAGLSVEPTRHRIELELGRRWTWCALDAVGIVGAIGDGVIHSETTDGHVRLEVMGGDVESNHLAVLVPDGDGMTSSVDQWCPLANFFPTAAAATAWAEANGVKGRAIPVTTVAPQLIERWRRVLDRERPEASLDGSEPYPFVQNQRSWEPFLHNQRRRGEAERDRFGDRSEDTRLP